MPKQKRMRLVKEEARINPMKELQAAHQGWERAIVSMAAMQEKMNDMKIELMKYRGY